ncbi:MAG: arginyltransferase, partial [Campylobacterota bacterium]|nr:arginyltransferase [Campylobacterota bacterium]
RYRYLNDSTPEEFHEMLKRGWRRFGKMNFVPECKGCEKCVSIRIDVPAYQFSKSEKRVLAKNSEMKIYIAPPSMSIKHLELYDKYHKHMSEKKQWNYAAVDASEYRRSYIEGGGIYAREILYMLENKLIGVALVDVLPDALSAIYCYYDHDYENLSLGKFSILAQIKIAKELNIKHLYLGYWIKDHYSMGYKENYQPFEILKNRPDLDEEPIWSSYGK